MNLSLLFQYGISPFFVALGLALLLTPLTIRFAWHFGLIDDPKLKKHPKVIHEYPVPRAGGLPIFFSLVITALIFLPLDKHLAGILAGSFIAVLIGTLDDKFDLSPLFRLFTNFLAAIMVVGAGIGIAFVSNPFGGIINLDQPRLYFEFFGQTHSLWILSDILALFWIVWCMNAINWSSGLDGQISGVVPIAAVTIGLLSLRFAYDVTQWPIIALAAITAGAYLGFLPFHLYPQKIMPGYGGTTLAGFLLATLAILSGAKIATAILVMGLPLTDGLYTLLRRLVQGKSPFLGDRGHLHHRLLDQGWGKRRIAVFYWLVTLILGLIALNLNSQQKFYAVVLLFVALGGLLYGLSRFSFKKPLNLLK
jgi:UDP-GlcNAc:undecaprenyl-phosphate GlcNAc-1-phosphate transferase